MARSDGAESDWTWMCYAPWLKYRCVLFSSAVYSQRQQIILQPCTMKSFDQNLKQLYIVIFFSLCFYFFAVFPFSHEKQLQVCWEPQKLCFWQTLNEKKYWYLLITEKQSSNSLENYWMICCAAFSAHLLSSCFLWITFDRRTQYSAVSSRVTP